MYTICGKQNGCFFSLSGDPCEGEPVPYCTFAHLAGLLVIKLNEM